MNLNWTDLGDLGARAMIYGGPYSNLQASAALFDIARELDFDPDSVICTGDTVGYCADPAATVALVRAFGGPVIAGNCERQIAAGAVGCGCGFAPGSACDLLSGGWYPHAAAALDSAARDWMANLPDLAVFTLAGKRYVVLHGGLSNISRFLWSCSKIRDFQDEIDVVHATVGPVDGVIAGHCGMPFQRRIGSVDWINAGAIGLPPHDGRPETRYVILTPQGPEFHALSYDHRVARQQMEAAGLMQGYHRTLETGIWPSEDVLPPQLRR